MIIEIYGEFIKCLKAIRSNKVIIIMGILPMTLFVFVFIQSFTLDKGASAWVVPVISEDGSIEPGSWKQKLIDSLESREGTIPYFSVKVTDLMTAERMFKERETFMIVWIPNGFEQNASTGKSIFIRAKINNIHEDLSKNLRLGLEARIFQFNENYQLSAGNRPGFSLKTSLVYEKELLRSDYMLAGIMVFADMFISMLNGGMLASEEKDKGTIIEIIMVPNGTIYSLLGKTAASITVTLFDLLVIFVFYWLIFGFTISTVSGLIATIIILFWVVVLFTFIGSVYGLKSGDFRFIPGPTVVITFTIWFLSGSINPLESKADSVIYNYLPTSAAIKLIVIELFGRGHQYKQFSLFVFGVWVILFLVVIAILLLTTISIRDKISNKKLPNNW